MGGLSKMLLGEDGKPPIDPGGHAFWKGSSMVVIEAQGYCHRALNHLDNTYSIWLARHHFEGVPVAKGIRDQCTKEWWVQARRCLTAVGLHVPGAPGPAGADCLEMVDLVFEQPYEPKGNCTAHRRQEKGIKFDVAPESAAVWPDCFMRVIAEQADDFGITCSMTAGEADGTLAQRLSVHSATVVVGSADKDIFMLPLGHPKHTLPARSSWTLVYPTRKHDQVVVLTPDDKLAAMATNFGVDLATVGAHYKRAEILYLAVAALTPHDYSYTKDPTTGTYAKAKTNVGGGSLTGLMTLVGEKLLTGKPVEEADYAPVAQEVYALISKVIATPGDYDKAAASAAKRCQKLDGLLTELAPAVVRAFLDQPVSPAPGDLTSAPYYENHVGKTDAGSVTGLAFPDYKYEGVCDQCPAVYPERWEPTDALKRAAVVEDSEWGGASSKAPKLFISDIIKITSEYRHKVEMGDGFSTVLDLVLGLMGRATFTGPKVKIATIDPLNAKQADEWPEGVPKQIGGAGTLIFVVDALAIQSCGIAAYVKLEHREGQHCRAYFALLCNKETGRFILNGGPGLGGTGWLGAWCNGCLSPFETDRHIISSMIYVSKIAPDKKHSSTSATKYWQQQALRGASDTSLPKLVHECAVSAVYISDILKRQITEKEATLWLMG